jgi:aryl-alcohol dehydrogenase-like predicted oxidoreductase
MRTSDDVSSVAVRRAGATLAAAMALQWVVAQPADSGVAAITGAELGATERRR